METEFKIPKKLIEVALPLDSINLAAKEEKAVPRRGHPQTLHCWWARRPLAAARAVIFAQMVNDPGFERNLGRGLGKEKAKKERERLFGILERLVRWENTNNEQILADAREEIWRSWRETCLLNKDHPAAKELFDPARLPTFHDPFAGGGAIPLEAQRLGLETFASDLNPVAVTINKAMVEIPPLFWGRLPSGPTDKAEPSLLPEYKGLQGLAEDVRRYGKWIQDQAEQRFGDSYPDIEITERIAKNRPELKSLKGQKLKVLGYHWARTVKSPNPVFSHVYVPLTSTFLLAKKKDKTAFVKPIIQKDAYSFEIELGDPPESAEKGTKGSGRGTGFRCILSGVPISTEYIKSEGQAGRLRERLMAIVAEGPAGRVYLPPSNEQEDVALQARPDWRPAGNVPARLTGGTCVPYGLEKWADLFTQRQLKSLTVIVDLISEVRTSTLLSDKQDREHLGKPGDGKSNVSYGDAISVYLSCALDRMASYNNTLCFWNMKGGSVAYIFARQAIAMSWDYFEVNPLAVMSGNWMGGIEWVADVIQRLPGKGSGIAFQADAALPLSNPKRRIISTDPPYFDNISYADLSDFFYVWLGKCLQEVFPPLFKATAVPKDEELVAVAYRHGDKEKAGAFFTQGMSAALSNIAREAHPAFPVTIYYAFKQAETNEGGTSSSGWDMFLTSVINAGLLVCGTWPMRTERDSGVKAGTNVLASSVVLVCRRRPSPAPTTSRREFVRELNAALPIALEEMTTAGDHSPVAPVDLSQAIIGPGMAIFSKYAAVLEADGNPMQVKTALQLINRFLAEDDFDHDTQFCLGWFEGHGWDKGKFGEADVLARAKGTSVDGLKEGGVVESVGGNVRLLRSIELPEEWSPESDVRISVWELLHHMIKRLNGDGVVGAGDILAQANRYSDAIRTLAYRLYTLCERKGWAQDAGYYNALVLAWDAIETSAQSTGYTGAQATLFGEEISSQGISDNLAKVVKKGARKKK